MPIETEDDATVKRIKRQLHNAKQHFTRIDTGDLLGSKNRLRDLPKFSRTDFDKYADDDWEVKVVVSDPAHKTTVYKSVSSGGHIRVDEILKEGKSGLVPLYDERYKTSSNSQKYQKPYTEKTKPLAWGIMIEAGEEKHYAYSFSEELVSTLSKKNVKEITKQEELDVLIKACGKPVEDYDSTTEIARWTPKKRLGIFYKKEVVST